MKKLKIITLGCRTNQYESELLQEQLCQNGYELAKDGQEADLCIVNTCSVTNQADATSRRQIRQAARLHPRARMIVTGCGAKDSLPAIDERIEIAPDKDKLAAQLTENSLLSSCIEKFDGHTRAFVKVQDGCNAFCTYCIVPYVRGRSRSRPLDEIVREAAKLAANGYKEIVLTGINIGDYESEGQRLPQLLQAVDPIPGLERVRISSIGPDAVDGDLIKAILQSAHICPNLHLVLQSGSNVVLKKMNRRYTRQEFLDTVERLLESNRDFTFTTDVIVGFPGETEADFQETCDVVRQVKFAKVHVFPYSPRSKTRAALYPVRVPPAVIRQRKEFLLALAGQTAHELRQQFIGRTMDALLEEGDEKFFFGHTANFLPVKVAAGSHQSGEIVQVLLAENGTDGRIFCESK